MFQVVLNCKTDQKDDNDLILTPNQKGIDAYLTQARTFGPIAVNWTEYKSWLELQLVHQPSTSMKIENFESSDFCMTEQEDLP